MLWVSRQGFSEDDKVAVGLMQKRSVLTSIFGGGSGRESPGAHDGADSESFADAWVHFLIEEADPEASGKTPRSGSGGASGGGGGDGNGGKGGASGDGDGRVSASAFQGPPPRIVLTGGATPQKGPKTPPPAGP